MNCFSFTSIRQWLSESIFCSVVRCRIYYILICGASSQPVLTLCIGDNNPSNQLRWLINFSSNAQARGDVVSLWQFGNATTCRTLLRLFFFQVFLLLGGQTGEINTGSDINNTTNEPTSLTLGLSVLSVVFLWMFLPYFAVCAVICLGWRVKQHLHWVLQSHKSSRINILKRLLSQPAVTGERK